MIAEERKEGMVKKITNKVQATLLHTNTNTK